MDWIRCSDRKPERGELVLAYFEPTKEHVIALWGAGGGHEVWSYEDHLASDDAITHWMPLPEPPTTAQ